MWSNSQPWLLLGGLMFYLLGVGMAQFLAIPINWQFAILGLGCVLMLQLTAYYTRRYFEVLQRVQEIEFNRTTRGRNSLVQLRQLRQAFLILSLTVLTIGAVLTLMLYTRGALKLESFLILGAAFLLAYFYAVPPLQLARRGYGELAEAVLLTNLAPGLAFLLQAGEFHRILPMLTFPVTLLFLAMKLALSLPGYAQDIKEGRKTLMIQLGWQRGMLLHNLLVFSAYILLLAASLIGLAWRVSSPALFSLPVGLFQVWQLVQIASGARTRWRLLTFTASATVALFTYLLIFSLFTG